MTANKLKNFACLLFLLSAEAHAQEDCAISLKNAQKTYEEGAIEKVAEVLAPCLEKGFSKAEKVEAYKLLVLTSFFENNRVEAENYMVKLLRLDPEYQINSAVDPPEFIKLYESYRTLPLYTIGASGGGNFSFVKVLNKFSVADAENSAGKYSAAVSYQVGVNVNRYLFDKAELSLDILFINNRFRYGNDDMFGYTSIDGTVTTESQNWLGIPLSMTYDFTKNKIRPYGRLGGGVGFLLSDNLRIERKKEGVSFAEGPDIDLLDPVSHRNKTNYWICAGAGVKYKIPRGLMIFDVRYNLGLVNQVNGNERYSNTELLYKYYYVDSNFKVSNLAFSVGYVRLLYKPQKKKIKN